MNKLYILFFSSIFFLSIFSCSGTNGPIAPVIELENDTVVEPKYERSAEIKVMTYNIYGGFPLGADRNDVNDYDLDGTIATIKNGGAEIIALNEISVGQKAATNYDNQPKKIAEALGYYCDFYGLAVGGRYGLALLSKYPILEIVHYQYEVQGDNLKGILKAKIQYPDGDFLVYVTHLQHNSASIRASEIAELKELASQHDGPKVILGDLNFTPSSDNHAEMTNGEFYDPWGMASTPFTYGTSSPKRIDYILGNSTIEFTRKPWSDTSIKTSDHFPVWAKIVLKLNQ